ncbi:MAG: zinc metallopeptidase [Anaerolineales bacterium]|uniref:Zinc metallopeptidase n=1 Tax=Candidatus Desulfolinea nitratireducens TaxID=2841698 RepID=A0A8J6NS66_9CHLR|nr:zinc metallopeptidase [Candidatus Desulfolinea nitratireducens]
MFFNPTYWLYMAPGLLLVMFTSWYVKAAYKKWSRVPASSRMNGNQAAQRLINAGGLYDVQIEGVRGEMTDHYDPRSKTLRLSQGVAQGASVASLAIAAHELGHAQQDAEGYFPLQIRSAMVPMVNIGSNLGWILIMAGLLLNWINVAWLGVAFFAGGALFALMTLPVEFNASARAKRLLAETGIIQTGEERRGVNNVLNAAALTYVAALVTSLLQLLYYASLLTGRRRR